MPLPDRPDGTPGPPPDRADPPEAPLTMQASEAAYRAIFDASSDAIFVHDADTGAILDTNPRTSELFGWTAAEFRSLSIVDFSTGEAPYTQAEGTAKVRAASGEPQTFLWHCRGKLGQTFWADVTLRRTMVDRHWRILAFVRDISDRIEAAQARERLLQQEQAARLAAEAAVAVREDFISIASHELKSPVTALTYSLHRLQQLLAASAGETMPVAPVQVVVGRAERQCRRLNQHINMLLDVSRIQAGQLHLTCENVDLQAIITVCRQDLADDARPDTVEIAVVAEGPVVGFWDRKRLEQVVFNLLANARKYGQGHPIEVGVGQRDGTATLTVTDHGIGIDPQDQATIFDRFGRAASSEHFSGLGLGLYIASSIAAAHGGTITVASQPGRGSTFSLSLPVAGPTASDAHLS